MSELQPKVNEINELNKSSDLPVGSEPSEAVDLIESYFANDKEIQQRIKDTQTEEARREDIKVVNLFNIKGFSVYGAVLVLICNLIYRGGNSSMSYVTGLSVLMLTGLFTMFALYKKRPDSIWIKRAMAAFVSLTFFYVMFFGHTEFRFAILFPPLCSLVMYKDKKVIFGIGIGAFALNLMNVIVLIVYFKHNTHADTARYLLQLSSVILTVLVCALVSDLYRDSFERNLKQNEQFHQMSLQTIETIARSLDAKDSYTQGHSRRVAVYSCNIARVLGYDDVELDRLRYTALLHDVGKIAVPDSVLNKPSRLSPQEYILMKSHTQAGGDILKDISSIPGIAQGARYHHERYDGKGYPDGISGEDIPLNARVICLADAFDAMTSNRVYRKQLPLNAVLEEIKNSSGTQFDPACVEAFLKYVDSVGEEQLFAEAGNDRSRFDDADIAYFEKALGIAAADIDTLTGVYNKTAGFDRIKAAMSHQKGTLVLFNIEGLKEINLKYGFRRGDYCLKVAATAAVNLKGDHIIARMDGNEFVIFVPGIIKRDEAEGFIKAYYSLLEETCKDDPLVKDILEVSASLAIHDDTGRDMFFHIRGLEKALYHLKNVKGLKYAFYEPVVKEGDELGRQQDIDDITDIILGRSPESDKPVMGEADFLNEVRELLEKGSICLVLYNVKPVGGVEMPLEDRNNVMVILEEALVNATGSRKHMFGYSSLQRAVIMQLENSSRENVKKGLDAFEEKVFSYFYKRYGRNDVELSYNHRMLEVRESFTLEKKITSTSL